MNLIKIKVEIDIFCIRSKVNTQYSGYRIMTPSAFTLAPYRPRFHYTVLSDTGYDLLEK